jgi:hypothetical protein
MNPDSFRTGCVEISDLVPLIFEKLTGMPIPPQPPEDQESEKQD